MYDLIINDSTDPFGYTEGLFTKEFYGSCYKALKDDGVMVYQHGSPFYDEDEAACRTMHRKVYRSFPISRVYQAHIPTSPSGYWLFGFASKKYHPLKDFRPEEWNALGIKTEYYTTTCIWERSCCPGMWKITGRGGKIQMSRLMIIGCGGVASVAVHKCCQNSQVFSEIMIASRTKSKCDALKEKLQGKTDTKITTAQWTRTMWRN